jgi:hypothetical protein
MTMMLDLISRIRYSILGPQRRKRILYVKPILSLFRQGLLQTYTDPNYYSQEGIATQRQIFESPFAPYFGEEFLSWVENYPSNWVVHPIPTPGDAVVIIISQGMRGYQVYLDGRYIGTEGTGGDLSDGRFSFNVLGGRYHYIRVYDG